MFHRVKSEIAPEDQQPQNTISKEEQATSESVENKQPQAVQNEPQTETKTTPTTEEKDKEPMIANQAQEKETKEDVTQEQEQATQTSAPEMPPGAYQRPGQAPGNYAPYSSSASTYSAPKAEPTVPAGDRTLTIGPGITMSGEIEACDYLLVEGTVEAALKGASNLEISETGTFFGTVEIDEATISGRFEGDITVNGRLTIRTGGVITGSIAYKELEVESGAIIDGRLTPVAAAPSAQQAKPKNMAKATPKVKTTGEEGQEPANTDGELFSNKAAS